MRGIEMIGKTDSKIVEELKKRLPVSEDCTESCCKGQPYAYLVDFAQAGDHGLKMAKESRTPVILLNVSAEDCVKESAVTVPAKAAVLFFAGDYTILSTMAPEHKRCEREDCIDVKSDGVVKTQILKPGEEQPLSTVEISDEAWAAWLEEKLEPGNRDELYAKTGVLRGCVGDVPTNLPQGQYAFQYISSDHDFMVDDQQKAHNAVLYEVVLIASSNPFKKYLRTRSYGAGFNPGTLHWNGSYDRGWFQNRIDVKFEPSDGQIVTFQSSPQNVNGQTTYTSGTSISIGVDISQNPGFKPSYTISDSVTSTISDFCIINHSGDKRCDWSFQLGMTKDSVWDLFKQDVFYKAVVKPLPALATDNLQANCEGVWMAPGDFTKVVDMGLSWFTEYMEAWETGNWAQYNHHVRYNGIGWGWYLGANPWRVNFANVHS